MVDRVEETVEKDEVVVVFVLELDVLEVEEDTVEVSVERLVELALDVETVVVGVVEEVLMVVELVVGMVEVVVAVVLVVGEVVNVVVVEDQALFGSKYCLLMRAPGPELFSKLPPTVGYNS